MKRIFLILCVAAVVVFTMGCKIILDSNYTRPLRYLDFKITNEISGWSEQERSFNTFNDPISLQAAIDGGYTVYTDNGMIEGLEQKLATADQRLNQARVMDFGSPEQARYEFDYMVSRAARKISMPGYPDSVVNCKIALSNIIAYAHFDKFYFELTLSNPQNSQAQAIKDAQLYLRYYQKKTEND